MTQKGHSAHPVASVPSLVERAEARAEAGAAVAVSGVRPARVLAILLVLALAMVSAPARAEADEDSGSIAVTAPADGAVLNGGFAGPIILDFSAAPTGDYVVEVIAPDSWLAADLWYSYDGTAETRQLELTFDEPLYTPGTWTVHAWHAPGGYVSVESTFDVRAPSAHLLAPVHGAHHKAEEPATARVVWNGIPADREVALAVENARGSTVRDCSWVGPSNGSTTTCEIGLLAAGDYTVRARYRDPDTGDVRSLAHSGIHVVDRLAVSDVALASAVFYPLVRDRFRDTAVLRYRTNAGARTQVTVANAAGRVMLRRDLGTQNAGAHTWRWAGRRADGAKVAKGVYTIRLAAVDVFGRTRVVERKVTVATGFVSERASKGRTGSDTSTVRVRGNCSGSPFHYSGELFLDCWGGRGYARATYGFTLPASATNVDWSVNTEQGCCLRGKFERRGYWDASNRFVVSVTIDSWRSVYIHGAFVSYTYQRRI